MTKQELLQRYLDAGYTMSLRTLSRLLNGRYFEQLALLGYERDAKLLSPCVVRKFYDLFGEPGDL